MRRDFAPKKYPQENISDPRRYDGMMARDAQDLTRSFIYLK